MKKTLLLIIHCGLILAPMHVMARDSALLAEARDGIDFRVAQQNRASGTLGRKVYGTDSGEVPNNLRLYVPTDMYIRMGGGWTAGFLSGDADIYDIQNGYTVTLGLGWNLLQVLRAEIAYSQNRFDFQDIRAGARSHQAVGMAYFDLLGRYTKRGDVVQRRTLVPFVGVGAGIGHLSFDDMPLEPGHDGIFWAPRLDAGFNIAVTDFVGIDLMYRYEIYMTDKFGWAHAHSENPAVSNFVASIRFNF
jgi:opacity protein-like surface antigen